MSAADFARYIQDKGVMLLLEDLAAQLLTEKPDDPYGALIRYLRQRPDGDAPSSAPPPRGDAPTADK